MRKLTIVIKRKRSAFGPADGIVLAGASYSLVSVSIGNLKNARGSEGIKRIREYARLTVA